jgi:succinate dehydrogenase / fumarate reductase, membrane anchor subunit
VGNGTQLGRVRGLGASGHGADHWLKQRTTAIANFALMIWFVASMLLLPDYSYQSFRGWLASPLAAVPLMLLVISVVWHFRLGLQVVIEDYVHDDGLKFGSLIALNFYSVGTAAVALFAIAKIAFTGTPN